MESGGFAVFWAPAGWLRESGSGLPQSKGALAKGVVHLRRAAAVQGLFLGAIEGAVPVED